MNFALNILIFLAAILAAVDQLIDKKYIDRIQVSIIRYWIFIDNMTISEKLYDSINRIYKYLHRIKNFYILFFLAGCTITLFNVIIGIYNTSSSDVSDALIDILGLDTHVNILEHSFVRLDIYNRYFIVADDRCIHNSLNQEFYREDIESFKQDLQLDYDLANMLEARSPTSNKVAWILGVSFVIISLSIFALCSLLISIYLTLYLMKNVGVSSLAISLIFIFDLITIIIIPVLLLILFLGIFSYLFYEFGYSVAVITHINHANTFGLAMYVAYRELYTLFFFLISIILNIEFGNEISITHYYFVFVHYAHYLFYNFLDSFKIAGDIYYFEEISYIVAVTNWSLFVDFLFSFSFIIPSLFLIAVARSSFLRMLVRNALEQMVSRGPITVVSIAIGGIAFLIKQLIS